MIRAGLILGILCSSAVVAAAEQAIVEEIEEIVVTASKKGATNLMETAVTATVFTGDQLETRQIRDAYDLVSQTPGLMVDYGGGTEKVSIRGVGASEALLFQAENGVTVYTNEVLLQRPQGITGALFDLERVDILKGPQGTAFGRNATGGSINYVSRRPVEGTDLELGLGGGSFGRQEAHGIFNYGNDRYGLRIGAKYEDEDGFSKNLLTGSDLDGGEQTVIKSAFSFAPTDSFDGILRAEFADRESTRATYDVALEPHPAVAAPGTVPLTSGGTVISTDPGEDYELYGQVDPLHTVETTLVSLHLNWNIGDLKLRSTTGYFSLEEHLSLDSDHSDAAFQNIPFRTLDSDLFSQEFILSGSAGAVDWLTGVYYLNEESHGTVHVELFGGALNVLFDDTQETTSGSAFAQGTWNINDRTRLTAGVRYTDDEKEITLDQDIVLGNGTVIPRCASVELKDSWSEVTWDLTLERNLTENTFAYAKVNTGFKSGGYNTTCIEGFEPEEITAYEIGYKGTFRNGTLTLATSAFYYDYTDLQVSRIDIGPTGAPSSIIDNAAQAEVYGVDFELRALLGERFSFDFGLSWLPTAEYEELELVDTLDAVFFDGDPATVSGPLDLAGNRLSRAPKFSGTLGFNFDSNLGANWLLDARLELYFTDDVAYSAYDRPNANNALLGFPVASDSNVQEAHQLLNAFVSFHRGDSWTIRFYGKNLTDEYYFLGMLENGSVGSILGFAGRPREAGVQVIYRFAGL